MLVTETLIILPCLTTETLTTSYTGFIDSVPGRVIVWGDYGIWVLSEV